MRQASTAALDLTERTESPLRPDAGSAWQQIEALTATPAVEPDRPNPIAAFLDEIEAAVEESRYAAAIEALKELEVSPIAFPEDALRALLAESWARMSLGELVDASALLERARLLSERPCFDDADRAQVFFQLGCCRFNLSSVANAISLLTHALALAGRSGRPCDHLRVRILDWRSRCHQHHREREAARADLERALELAQSLGDDRLLAQVRFQESLVAERNGEWLIARFHAEEARDLYERAGDRLGVHKALNNLGGINFLLGEEEHALESLKESFRIALELGDDVAGSYAMCSLAQVQLRLGAPEEAEQHARRALELLEGRVDHLNEIGNAELVLGRALLAQGCLEAAGELFDAAERSFERLTSVSHRAAAWIAQGELADAQGDKDTAAERYRRAAEALQDFHF